MNSSILSGISITSSFTSCNFGDSSAPGMSDGDINGRHDVISMCTFTTHKTAIWIVDFAAVLWINKKICASDGGHDMQLFLQFSRLRP